MMLALAAVTTALAPVERRRGHVGRAAATATMMLALVVAATALAPVERLYLRHGHRANSFSAAFDPDLERHVTDQGFVAFARHECTRTSLAFFDPVGGEIETVLDSFINQERRRGRVAFWKV